MLVSRVRTPSSIYSAYFAPLSTTGCIEGHRGCRSYFYSATARVRAAFGRTAKAERWLVPPKQPKEQKLPSGRPPLSDVTGKQRHEATCATVSAGRRLRTVDEHTRAHSRTQQQRHQLLQRDTIALLLSKSKRCFTDEFLLIDGAAVDHSMGRHGRVNLHCLPAASAPEKTPSRSPG